MNNMEIKVSVKDVPEVIEQLQQAEDKINNLQSKIDKAIEFIKEKGCYYSGDFDDILDLYDLNDLLNILQGDDK